MAKYWNYAVPSFDMPTCFLLEGPDAERRREILREHAMRWSEVIETWSYYELWNIPNDEILATAVERERASEQAWKMSGEKYLGLTADRRDTYEGDRVYSFYSFMWRKTDPVELQIVDVSDFRFLLDCRHPDGHNLILPSNMVFKNRDVANFMRREIVAYESDLETKNS